MLPRSFRSALANSGGYNRRSSRFAGRLAIDRDSLTEDELIGICHALILPNGVRKTTDRGRNTEVLQSLLRQDSLRLASPCRVLDVGASIGSDAFRNCELLQKHATVAKYELGDLYPSVLYDDKRGLVFSEDGQLLQVRLPVGFFSMYFEHNFAFQRALSAPQRLLSKAFWQNARIGGEPIQRLRLVLPALEVDSPTSPFSLRRLDVFEPFEGEYDLILCLHLLVPRYFSQSTIEEGIANLRRNLAVNGSLIVGAADDDLRIVRRQPDGEYAETVLVEPVD